MKTPVLRFIYKKGFSTLWRLIMLIPADIKFSYRVWLLDQEIWKNKKPPKPPRHDKVYEDGVKWLDSL